MADQVHRSARWLIRGAVAAITAVTVALSATAHASHGTGQSDVSVTSGQQGFNGMFDRMQAAKPALPARRPVGNVASDPNEYVSLPECHFSRMMDGMPVLVDDTFEDTCSDSPTTCALRGGGEAVDIFRKRPGEGAFSRVASRCPNGQDADPAELGRRLRSPFSALVPSQRPGIQPNGRALINKETIFYAGQPATLNRVIRVQGLDVRIVADATFTWQFDRSVRETFTTPGAPYPNMDVTHTYTTPGKRRVTLTTTWRGQYQIGDGPLQPIPGAVEQVSEPLTLTLVESRPQLVAPED